jgi:hypothetical protein
LWLEAEKDDEDSTGKTAKIVGGVIAGLLIVGSGIYAYEEAHAPAPPEQVALKTPVTNHIANDQYPTSAPLPESSTTPAATPPTSPPPVRRTIRAAENSRPAHAADDAINAPMTLTPETAPPPQPSQSSPQMAMRQPFVAPNALANQPTSSVAANDTMREPQTPTQPADPSLAPTEQAEVPAAQAQDPNLQ